MKHHSFLSGLVAGALLVGAIVAVAVSVDAAPNNNVPVAPALPGSVTAAPTALSITTPWNCFAGDMAGQLCNINSELVMSVGFLNPNNNRKIGQVYQIKLTSDGSSVTATDITGGANTVINWNQPANAATKFANTLDFLNTAVSRVGAKGTFAITPSL